MNSLVLIALSLTLGSFAVGSFDCTPVAAKHSAPNTTDPSDENYKIGMEKARAGDYDGAIDAFLQSIDFARNNYKPLAYFNLAKAYMAKHNEDPKAIDALNHAIQQSLTPMPQAYILLAQIYDRQGDDTAEVRAINMAMQADPGPAYQAHNMMGLYLQRKGDLSGADMQFTDALGEAPWTYTEAWLNYAENFMKMKNWVEGLKQCQGMLNSTRNLHLDYPRIYLDMGLCLLAKGDHQGAIDNWHNAIAYDAKNPDPHLQLGMIFDTENHISSAITEYEEFIRLSDDKRKVTKAKERILYLQRKIAPPETEPTKEQPSIYQREKVQRRQQQREQLREEQQLQQMQQRGQGQPGQQNGNQQAIPSGDSGF